MIPAFAEHDDALTCESIWKIGRWGVGRYGGNRRINPRSVPFADRALELFVQKLDPYRVLFTQADADSFKRRGAEAWGRVMNARYCGYFDHWVRQAYPRAQASLRERLRSIEVESYFPKTLPEEASEGRFKKFHGFAASETELRGRLLSLVKSAAGSASRMVVAAYGGDRRRYVEDSIEQFLFDSPPVSRYVLAKAFLGAIDPFSTYFSKPEFDDFYADLAGGASGVGVRVRRVPRGLLVERILKDSPAASSKLKSGDVITVVDGTTVASLPPRASKRLLSGPEATRVKLRVERVGARGALDISVLRRRFTFEEARLKARRVALPEHRGEVAVVEIPTFYGRGGVAGSSTEHSSAEDLRKIVAELAKPVKAQGPRVAGLVLDMRGNPGGYLEEAVSMGGLFLGDKPVVGVVEGDSRRTLSDARPAPLFDGPMVVLVDDSSASAAEILAGALRDHGRAVVVGADHTYGKGSVQKLFHLDDEGIAAAVGDDAGDGVVKLTTSLFYSPMGHSPANGGVASQIKLPVAPSGSDSKLEGTANAVPEEAPFLSSDDETQVKVRGKVLDAMLVELRKRSAARMKGVPTPPPADEDTGAEIAAAPSATPDRLQVEAAAIVGDIASLGPATSPHERRAVVTRVSTRPALRVQVSPLPKKAE